MRRAQRWLLCLLAGVALWLVALNYLPGDSELRPSLQAVRGPNNLITSPFSLCRLTWSSAATFVYFDCIWMLFVGYDCMESHDFSRMSGRSNKPAKGASIYSET
jgi:hypothetical protein